jgi:hypothetical protein
MVNVNEELKKMFPLPGAPKHPERKPGQRWRFEWQGTSPPVREFVIEKAAIGFSPLAWLTTDGIWEDGCWDEGSVWTARLLSDVPAAVDRAACKAWCGLPCVRRGWPLVLGVTTKVRPIAQLADPAWCSAAYRDAKLPPLETKPAEAAKAKAAQIAEVKMAPCDRCRSNDDVRFTIFDARANLFCKRCRHGLEAWISAQHGDSIRTQPPGLPAPSNLCPACRGAGGFDATGNPTASWFRDKEHDRRCGRCDGKGIAR